MNKVHYSCLLHKQEQISGNGSNVVVSMTVQPDIFYFFHRVLWLGKKWILLSHIYINLYNRFFSGLSQIKLIKPE